MLTVVDVCILGVRHEASTAAVATALLLIVVVALALVVVTTIHNLLAFLDDVVHVERLGRVLFDSLLEESALLVVSE